MKNSLLLLAGAAALSLASCGEKKTETTETTATETVMTGDPNTAVVMDNDEMYKQRSMRVADKYIADMKVTDAAMQEKIRMAYYNRSKRYGEARAQYQADTTGMAAAMREANMATDAEFKTIYADPTQYQAYESSRSTYDERNYMDDNSTASGEAASTDASAGNMTSAEEGKTKMADGSKMKVSADGDIKIKDAEGNKTKVDGDDGTVKLKPAGEEKTKIK